MRNKKNKKESRIILMTENGKVISPASPSCPKCHTIFKGIVYVDNGLAIDLNASGEKGLAITQKIHCNCGEIIKL